VDRECCCGGCCSRPGAVKTMIELPCSAINSSVPCDSMGAKDGEHLAEQTHVAEDRPEGEASASHRLDYNTTYLRERERERGGEGGAVSNCERFDVACIGRPCDSLGRCPYYDISPGCVPVTKVQRNKQKGRAYWAITSANKFYSNQSKWWLTLTNYSGKPVEKSWHSLRDLLHKTKRSRIMDWLLDFNRPGFSRKESIYGQIFYNERYDADEMKDLINFKYIAIRTSEGNGVYHCFVYGDMLPASFIRHFWKKYSGAVELDIQRVKDMDRVTRYALSQYAVGQDKFVRASWSRDLIYPEGRNVWKRLYKEFGYDDGLKYWKYCMMVYGFPDAVIRQQTSLSDFNEMYLLKHSIRLVSFDEAMEYWRLHPEPGKKKVGGDNNER